MLHCLSIISTLFIISILKDFTHSLRLVEVRIPNYVIRGSHAQLECLYDLDGEALYSVKWYKDGNEFYRYVPRDMPPAQTFLLPGVLVDLHNSSDAIVTLRDVNLQSAGRFRCEVSGEAPSFQTVTEHGDMVVVSLPDQGPPKILGGRPRYQLGDWVRINCTAGRSKPAVQLSWFVNGEPAEPHHLRKYETILYGRDGLETSVLGLQFRVEQHHFRNGDMKLKCVASLSTFYWRSNEESVEGDRPQKAPVLESRETVYASNSRADPVQASKTDSHAPSTLLLLALAIAVTLAGCSGSGRRNHHSHSHSQSQSRQEAWPNNGGGLNGKEKRNSKDMKTKAQNESKNIVNKDKDKNKNIKVNNPGILLKQNSLTSVANTKTEVDSKRISTTGACTSELLCLAQSECRQNAASNAVFKDQKQYLKIDKLNGTQEDEIYAQQNQKQNQQIKQQQLLVVAR